MNRIIEVLPGKFVLSMSRPWWWWLLPGLWAGLNEQIQTAFEAWVVDDDRASLVVPVTIHEVVRYDGRAE